MKLEQNTFDRFFFPHGNFVGSYDMEKPSLVIERSWEYLKHVSQCPENDNQWPQHLLERKNDKYVVYGFLNPLGES